MISKGYPNLMAEQAENKKAHILFTLTKLARETEATRDEFYERRLKLSE